MASNDNDSSREPAVPPAAKKLTVKQEREQRRLAKVEAFKKEQARAKRNRLTAIILSSVAAVAVVALIVFVVISNATPQRERGDITVEGVQSWDWETELDFTHVETAVDYEAQYGIDPPAGGSHNPAWLNCGIYTEPVPNENAVHSLEHGAIWVTYDAEALDEAEVETLRAALPDTYIVLSPYEGLEAPVVASAWGFQIELDGVDDERLTDFVDKYWQNPELPEAGAPCTGGIDGPGKVA